MKRHYILLMIIACLLSACEYKFQNTQENQPLPVEVQRYDRLQSRYLTTGDYSALQQMSTEYPMETRTLIEDMLHLGEVNDPEINARFLNFYQDTLLQMMISDSELQYAAMDDINRQLSHAFEQLLRLIPGLTVPTFYAQISALGESIVVGDSMVGISLDKYLGADYPVYRQFYDEQQRQTMSRQYIVPDCIVFYLLSLYPMENFENRSQQERDLHMGKIMWVANKAMGTHFFKTRFTQQADSLRLRHPQTAIPDFLQMQ